MDVACGVSFDLLDSVARSAERLCEADFVAWEHKRKVSVLCLLYKIYHRADHLLHEYLHHFITAHNTIELQLLCVN